MPVDRELAAQFERHLPRLRQVTPSKQIANWQERVARVSAGVDIFYVLPRLLRPSLVVETGVASGSMTSLLLAALNRNKHGTMLSFDLPPVAGKRSMDWSVKDDSEIGFLIPEAYKDRWSLTLGDATYELPKALQGRSLDCFFHDSDHEFKHMTFEYALAAKHLAKNGWIVSDDITWNDSFYRFFGGLRAPMFVHEGNANIGVAVP